MQHVTFTHVTRNTDIYKGKGNTCEIIDTRIWADNFVTNEAC